MVTGLMVNLRFTRETSSPRVLLTRIDLQEHNPQIWTITAIHEEDFAAFSLATTIQTSKARLMKNCVV